MRYVSTRGSAPELDFEGVLLAGLARDGGLYMPKAWPVLEVEQIRALAGRPYADVAREIMRPFVVPSIEEAELGAIIADAYAGFRHAAVVPLVQIAPGDWLLELFHGPTLAFKDVAMQVLARLMDLVLARRGARTTIIVATSGDTGAAAAEAFRGRAAIDLFILYPHGRVSDVQRRQMTTPPDENVHALEIEGTFDDCQALVKALFNDHALRDRLALAGVNSINWARIMAQIVYYFTSGVALGAPDRPVSFSVPTGNFGDIFAGYAALSMGLPIEHLVIATNENDILVRTLESGRYEQREVVATTSPSMDIQVSSNFERLIYELAERDSDRVQNLMASLAQSRSFTLNADELSFFRHVFRAGRADQETVSATIRTTLQSSGALVDPHTAVGLAVAGRQKREPAIPMVTLATAHPAKFPEAIARAVGHPPAEPELFARQRGAKERVNRLANDYASVARFIEAHARRGGRA